MPMTITNTSVTDTSVPDTSVPDTSVTYKKTVGQIGEELLINDTSMTSLPALSQAIQEKYAQRLFETCEQGIKAFPSFNFFIVINATKDPAHVNLWKHQRDVIGLCPRPNYDQTVFRYNHDTGNLEHLWTIPSRNDCIAMKRDKHLVDPIEYPLLDNVLKFADGTLARWRNEFNKDQEERAVIKGKL